MKRFAFRFTAAAVLLAGLLLSGCAGGGEENAGLAPVPEEKKLVLYTSHKEEVYEPIIKEFEERTGIWVQVKTGGTRELLEEIGEGQKDGKAVCDVMFGGGIESYEAGKENFEPYQVRTKDRLNPRYVSADDSWTAFTALPIVLIYNNKLVSREEAPTGWESLFEEKWKGKIAFADPAVSGSSCTMLETLLQILGQGEDETLERFAKALDGNQSESSGGAIEEVVSGSRLVGITLEETAKKQLNKGADLSIVYPVEGTSALPDGCAVVKGAPHRENAGLFLEFIVGDDVQRLAVEYLSRRTCRRDLKLDGGETNLRIAEYDVSLAAERQERILEKWAVLTDEELH